jgi:hypothetical protein
VSSKVDENAENAPATLLQRFLFPTAAMRLLRGSRTRTWQGASMLSI